MVSQLATGDVEFVLPEILLGFASIGGLVFFLWKITYRSKVTFDCDQNRVTIDQGVFWFGKPYLLNFDEINVIEVTKDVFKYKSIVDNYDFEGIERQHITLKTYIITRDNVRILLQKGDRLATKSLIQYLNSMTSIRTNDHVLDR